MRGAPPGPGQGDTPSYEMLSPWASPSLTSLETGLMWDGEWKLPHCTSRVLVMSVLTLKGMDGSEGSISVG